MHKNLKINLHRGLIEDKEKLYFKIQNMKSFILLNKYKGAFVPFALFFRFTKIALGE
jgi:hypothetical protein